MSEKEKNQETVEKEVRPSSKETPATDVYSEIEKRLPDTKVDIPTEKAVEEAKDWVENENQR